MGDFVADLQSYFASEERAREAELAAVSPAFEHAEDAGRLDRLRRAMSEAGVDVVLLSTYRCPATSTTLRSTVITRAAWSACPMVSAVSPAPAQPGVGGGVGHQLITLAVPTGGQRPAEPADVPVGRDLVRADPQSRFAGHAHRGRGQRAARGLPVHPGQPRADQVPAVHPGADQGRDHPPDPGAFARAGAALTICCMCPAVMSWQVTPAITGAANRWHSRAWVCACLRDHRLSAGSRSGSRYQAIRSAPGASRPGAPAASRSVTYSSLTASSASVTACRNRRRPFSVNVARHTPTAPSGGYTRTPHPTSTTTRAEPRADSRASPLTRGRPRSAVLALPGERRAG